MIDSHCHVSTVATAQDVEAFLAPHNVTCFVMATCHIDVELVAALSHRVVPFLGIHPWYSHLFAIEPTTKLSHYAAVLRPPPPPEVLAVLPDPILLQNHLDRIAQLGEALQQGGREWGVGEIGLDKVFRVPTNGFYGNPDVTENITLTSCKVSMDHQIAVFKAQLDLAERLQKCVSLHCVKAHGPFFETVSRYSMPVILHSYSGSVEQAKAWVRRVKRLYFSFSNYINGTEERRAHLKDLLQLLNRKQVLIESDMPVDRYSEDAKGYLAHLEGITLIVGILAEQLEENAWAALRGSQKIA